MQIIHSDGDMGVITVYIRKDSERNAFKMQIIRKIFKERQTWVDAEIISYLWHKIIILWLNFILSWDWTYPSLVIESGPFTKVLNTHWHTATNCHSCSKFGTFFISLQHESIEFSGQTPLTNYDFHKHQVNRLWFVTQHQFQIKI